MMVITLFIINCLIIISLIFNLVHKTLTKVIMHALKLCDDESIHVHIGSVPYTDERIFVSGSSVVRTDDSQVISKDIFIRINLLYSLIYEISNIKSTIENNTNKIIYEDRDLKMDMITNQFHKNLNLYEKVIFSVYRIVIGL